MIKMRQKMMLISQGRNPDPLESLSQRFIEKGGLPVTNVSRTEPLKVQLAKTGGLKKIEGLPVLLSTEKSVEKIMEFFEDFSGTFGGLAIYDPVIESFRFRHLCPFEQPALFECFQFFFINAC